MRILRRVHHDEAGQSLVIVLSLVTFLFLLGSALAVQASTALRTSAAGDTEADALHAADAGAELGIWWQRQGNAGNPPSITVNGLTVTTTVSSTLAAVSGTGWKQWGFGGQSLGASSEPGPATASSRWSPFPTVTQGATVASPSVADDGYVYVGGSNGLYAYAPDGSLAWSFVSAAQSPALGGFIGSPAIVTTGGGAKMIVAATDGTATTASTVVGLTENGTKTGVSVTWSYSLGNGAGIGFVGGPKVNTAGTRAYIAARNSTVYALSTAGSGVIAPLWSAATGGAVTTAVALNTAQDRVYVATSTGILRAYSATTGAQFWTRNVSAGDVLTAPIFATVAARDHVYTASGADNRIYATRDSGGSGSADWNVNLAANAFSVPAVLVSGGQTFLYVATDTGGIHKIEDTGNGRAIGWIYTPFASGIRSSVVTDSGNAIYAGNEAGTLMRIADGGATASTTWTSALGLGAVRSGLAVGVDNDLYAVTTGNRLLAAGPAATPATVTVTATAGSATVTTTYPNAGAGSPNLATWTTTK
ncbi:MAG TPA: PQQ-binding-like beta-propeller repeat protein [Candidatus Limnocylindria bacterium]|nr:PQQ-binding-like beta-propeller repeat protein [Candidatus Limnocylindria bacterium]